MSVIQKLEQAMPRGRRQNCLSLSYLHRLES